jgi:hypothetical protein
MNSFYTRFRNLPLYAHQDILERERRNRLIKAAERGRPLQYANANLQSLASMREVSRRPIFNQLAEQGTALPPNIESHILEYLGTKRGQTVNSVIKHIAAKKKKEAHNAMVREKLLEAETRMKLEPLYQQTLREEQKRQSRAARGKNYNNRGYFSKTGKKQQSMYINKPNSTRKTKKNIKKLK